MRRLRHLLLTATALIPIAPALAGPNGGVVVGGSANIQSQGSANVTVNQFSDKAIINWNLFNIGVGEKTTFVQPNSNSIALNRVVGGLGPSEILGTLTANGKVFVVNRDGIIFGAGAVVTTAGFLATTSDIKNEDFMAGRFNFQIPGRGDASIVNMGTITATNGGFAALVAPGVRNSGTITAYLGTVTLASGNTFNLDFYGDRLVQLGIGDEIAGKVKDVATGQTLKSLVTNEGRLKANGGRVELTAAAARQVVDSVINTSGVVEANSVGMKNGQIVLGAATATYASAQRGQAAVASSLPPQKVKVSGTLSAAGKKAGTKGGSITITGEHIEVAGATIDASGREGGGKVLIGGDWGGGKPDKSLVANQSATLESKAIPTATTVSVDAATKIDASAKDKGDGGKVVLWADGQLSFAGTILALGGKEFGNGGFVETSSHGLFNVSGTVNAGRGGTWLLDPPDLIVDNALAGSIQTSLNNGTNVTQNTGTTGAGNGDIIFNSGVRIEWNTSATLTLIAFHDIKFNDGAFGTPPGNIVNTGAGNLNMRADSTGIGSGTLVLTPFTNPTRINWTASTGTISLYYNPTTFGTQNNFTSGNGNIQVANASQLQQYMLVNTTAQLNSIGTNPATLGEKYAIGPATLNAAAFAGFGAGTTFTGILTGNGGLGTNSSISGLTTSLFPFIGSTGAVRDLNLISVNIAASGNGQQLSPLAGQNSGTISNVTAIGTINGGAFNGITAGGLVAQNMSGGTISGSNASVTVTVGNGVTGPSGFNYSGGLVGINNGTINGGSSAIGTITGGTNSFAGGLIGQNNAAISGLSASGNVSGGGSVGGLVGFNAASTTITGGSATGNVTATGAGATLGGLVGQNLGTITSGTVGSITVSGGTFSGIIAGGLVGQNQSGSQITNSSSAAHVTVGNGTTGPSGGNSAGGLVAINQGQITNSSASGAVEGGANAFIGGLAGRNDLGTISNSSASGNVTTAFATVAGGLVGGNSGVINSGSSASGNVATGAGGSAGGLVGQNEATISGASASGNVSGTGTSSLNVLLGGLVANNHSSNITNSSAAGTVSTGGFASVGGLIGANSGNLSNLTAANTLTLNGNQVTAGGLIGNNSGNLSNMLATNNVSASGNQVTIGGLVGFNTSGTITNSRATGNVTSTGNATSQFDNMAAGGLVGSNNGTITGTSQPNVNTACAAGASCATGNVSVGSHGAGGGLVGFNQGNVTNSFATGIVTGAQGLNDNAPTNIGGLIGLSSGGTISGSHARGAVGGNVAFLSAGGLVGDNGSTINNSFATGNVTAGNTSMAGGLVGGSGGGCPGCTGNISNSTASGNVTVGATSVAGGLAGGSGEGATLSNTSATGTVTGGHDSVIGGLVGGLDMGTITGSQASGGAVVGTGANVMAGGLVGVSFGTIMNSTASKTVTVATDSYAGGLVGGTVGHVENSTASGAVNGGSNSVLGGLAGANAGTITQSSASGAVTTGDFGVAGGLAGGNIAFEGAPAGFTLPGSSFPSGTIVGSSSTGAVTGGANSKVGGLIGINGGSISGLSSSATVSGGDQSIVGGLVAVNGGPSGGPAFPSAITGCQDCPLGSLSVSSGPGTIANSSASGQLTGGLLSTVGGLVGSNPGTITGSQSTAALNQPNAAVLGGLVGLNDTNGSIVNSSASGVVTGSTFAVGGLVGSNVGSISGSSASGNVTGGPDATIGGLAGFNIGAISNSNASGNVAGGPGGEFGGLVGFNAGTITHSFATGAVNVDPGIGGGLVGLNTGAITGSHASGAVTGDDGSFVGGLVGFNLIGSIQNSFSVSTVTTGAGGAAGGLVALNFGSIGTSFATGKVAGGDGSYVGGLVAFNFGTPAIPGQPDPQGAPTPPVGVISQSYATGAVTGGANSVVGGLVAENAGSIDQGYAAGRVIGGAGSITGGLVASNNFTVPGGNPLFPQVTGTAGTATNSYWDTQTTGQSASAGGSGQTSAQLTNTLPAGFSPSVWTSGTGRYPFFIGQSDPLPVPGDPVTVNPPVINPPVINPPVTNPQLPQTPDHPLADNTTIVLISPQTSAGATNPYSITTDDKKSDLVINNPTPSGGTGAGGGSPPGGQKGGAPAGGGQRPPASAVAAFGLGPLPSGMPPLNEVRFLNNEVAFQLGGRMSDGELRTLLAGLKLEVLYEEEIGLLGRKVLRLRLPAGATVRGMIPLLEARGVNFSAQPIYQFEMVQDLAQAPSPADTNRKGDSAQYIVEKLSLPEAHLIATGKDVKVAVIDSEIDQKHPDLEGAITANYDALPSDDLTAHPHGTGMAGAIASHKRLLGIAPNARILGVRAFGVNTGGAQGTSMNIVKGLQWAVDQGAKVINMSFAGPKDPILQQAMQRLTEQGIILIAAAGNAGPKSPPLFPGADPNVIAVSATDVDNKTYKNANRGKYVAISSPGVDILVPAPEGGYQLTTGTSVAAAHISGVVALMLERNKELKPAEVRNILTATAKNIGGVKTDVGAGLVDPVQALAKSGPKSAGLQ